VEGPPRPYKLWQVRDAHALICDCEKSAQDAVAGFTAPHSDTLTLRPDDDVLLLYGWTEYYDSSTNYDAFHIGLAPRSAASRSAGWARGMEDRHRFHGISRRPAEMDGSWI